MAAKEPHRRDPRELLQRCPAVFEGLSDGEISDRLEFWSLKHASDPFDGLDEMLRDDKPPQSAGDAALEPILGLLLPLLRAECEKHGRGVVADYAEAQAGKILDAARRGRTRGEQRAAMLLRHPRALQPPKYRIVEKDYESRAPDARSLGVLPDPIDAIRMKREVRELQERLRPLLADRRRRAERRKDLFAELRSRYPQLQRHLRKPRDVDDLTPAKGARAIWGALQRPAISGSQVENRLATASFVILFYEDRTAWIKRYGR